MALKEIVTGEVNIWDTQFVQPILQPEWLNQSWSQQSIWSPEEQLEKFPAQCGMPVGNDDNAPKLAVFPVTPTVQGDTEVDGAVPGLTLSKYSHSADVSLPSSAGLGRDICLTKVLGSVLITLPDHCVHVCGGGCVWDQGVVLPTSVKWAPGVLPKLVTYAPFVSMAK